MVRIFNAGFLQVVSLWMETNYIHGIELIET
jgi:hypothetical protein